MIINNKEVVLKFNLRVMFVFERLTGKTFEIKNTLDMYVLFYSVLIASNEDLKLTFNEFIDLCDENPSLFNDFCNWMSNTNKVNNQFIEVEDNKKKV